MKSEEEIRLKLKERERYKEFLMERGDIWEFQVNKGWIQALKWVLEEE